MITTLQITGVCNLNCTFCLDDYKNESHMTLDCFDEVLEFLKQEEIKRIILTGGEPLLHPEINHIIEKLHKADIKINMNTNATRMDKLQPSSLEKLNRLLISIDGDTPTMSELMTRGEESFNASLEMIQKVSKLCDVTVQTIVSKKNSESIVNLGQLLVNHQIDKWHVRPFLSLGQGKQVEDRFVIEDDVYQKVLKQIINTYPTLDIEPFKAGHKFSFMHITPDGSVKKVINDKIEKDGIS
jgi:MoaA/NifB/PqqE/SkfB family radical SAM enzyme